LTQANASDAGYDALTQSWLVWCKQGAIAKTAKGQLGVVTLEPDWEEEIYTVTLRFSDGKKSREIDADSLTRATAADVGYEALVRAEAQRKAKTAWCRKGVVARTVGGKLGVVRRDPNRNMKRWVDDEVRLRFADGDESDPMSANLLRLQP
jgi:hypothetical protein